MSLAALHRGRETLHATYAVQVVPGAAAFPAQAPPAHYVLEVDEEVRGETSSLGLFAGTRRGLWQRAICNIGCRLLPLFVLVERAGVGGVVALPAVAGLVIGEHLIVVVLNVGRQLTHVHLLHFEGLPIEHPHVLLVLQMRDVVHQV